MRKIEWQWGDQQLEFTPNMLLLADMAQTLARVSGGLETTPQFARKLVNGGAEVVYAASMARKVLAASGVMLTDEDCYTQMAEQPAKLMSLSIAFVEAFLPQVDFGKKPEAPAAAQKPKEANGKKSTSKTSTRSRGTA